MIPTRGYAVHAAGTPLVPYAFDRREPGPTDVLIDIQYCGVCHSDIHQARGGWGGETFPMVPGHEIAGTIARVGSAVTRFTTGDRVGVGVFVDACRTCGPCTSGHDNYCAEGITLTYGSRERGGDAITMGGYSQRIVVDERYVLRMPAEVALDAGAPLLCAGITVYSPLRHWRAAAGKKVAVMGLGGLGHMAVKFAHAFGAEVTVLSQSLRKEHDARTMGADHVYATNDPQTFRQLRSRFDLIINTVSADIDWSQYLGLLGLDGAMVAVALPETPVPVSPFALITNRRTLAGSAIGSIAETQEMLDFCARHRIAADVETIAIDRINDAYARVLASDVRYRFVIDMATLA